MDVEKALQTQLANIQRRTGKSLEELHAWIRATGLGKHGEIYLSLRRKVRLSAPAEVDAELVAWLRTAYDAAG